MQRRTAHILHKAAGHIVRTCITGPPVPPTCGNTVGCATLPTAFEFTCCLPKCMSVIVRKIIVCPGCRESGETGPLASPFKFIAKVEGDPNGSFCAKWYPSSGFWSTITGATVYSGGGSYPIKSCPEFPEWRHTFKATAIIGYSDGTHQATASVSAGVTGFSFGGSGLSSVLAGGACDVEGVTIALTAAIWNGQTPTSCNRLYHTRADGVTEYMDPLSYGGEVVIHFCCADCNSYCAVTWESVYECAKKVWGTPYVVAKVCLDKISENDWIIDRATGSPVDKVYARKTVYGATCPATGTCDDGTPPDAPDFKPALCGVVPCATDIDGCCDNIFLIVDGPASILGTWGFVKDADNVKWTSSTGGGSGVIDCIGGHWRITLARGGCTVVLIQKEAAGPCPELGGNYIQQSIDCFSTTLGVSVILACGAIEDTSCPDAIDTADIDGLFHADGFGDEVCVFVADVVAQVWYKGGLDQYIRCVSESGSAHWEAKVEGCLFTKPRTGGETRPSPGAWTFDSGDPTATFTTS